MENERKIRFSPEERQAMELAGTGEDLINEREAELNSKNRDEITREIFGTEGDNWKEAA